MPDEPLPIGPDAWRDAERLHTLAGWRRRPRVDRPESAGPPVPAWQQQAYAHAHALRVDPCMSVEAHRALVHWGRTGGRAREWPDYDSVPEPPLLLLMRGAPGSGKSTWAADYKARWPQETVVISATEYFREAGGPVAFRAADLQRSHAWCAVVCEWLCELRTPRIVVDNTNIRAWEYACYRYMAGRYVYRCFQQVCTGTWPNRSGVPETTVHEMRRRWEEDRILPHYRESPEQGDRRGA